MKSWRRFIQAHTSCCLNCGSFLSGVGLLCRPCDRKLHDFSAKTTYPVEPFLLRSLYYWHPGQSDLLSHLVLALKGKSTELIWQYYAERFVQKIIPFLPLDRSLYLVPAPTRRPGEKDHASLWAEAVAKALGATVVPCLKRVSSHHQRGADRGERALIEMEILENYTGNLELKNKGLWIFADDVLTTGATARAAHKALGSPPHFEAWVLAQRGLSCGASRDLL